MDCLRKIDWGGLLLLPLPWLVEELLEEEEVLVGWLVGPRGGWLVICIDFVVEGNPFVV